MQNREQFDLSWLEYSVLKYYRTFNKNSVCYYGKCDVIYYRTVNEKSLMRDLTNAVKKYFP